MRSRSIIRALAAATGAATIAAAVTVAPAATTTPPRAEAGRCIVPTLVGLTEHAAVRATQAAGCVVHLAGAPLKQATIQTIAAQAPAAGARTTVVRLTLNPFCFGSALAGPPDNEGLQRGPTELITGLYVVGGPALPYSTPRCQPKPGKPTTGTIEVRDSADGMLIASRTVAHARLETFTLAPGRYRVDGRFQNGTQTFTEPFTIRAGYTTRRYVIEPVP